MVYLFSAMMATLLSCAVCEDEIIMLGEATSDWLESSGIMFLQWKKPIFGRTVGQSTLALIKTQKDTIIFTGGKNISEQKLSKTSSGAWCVICYIKSFLFLKIFHIFVIKSEIFRFNSPGIPPDLSFYLSLTKQKDCLRCWPWNFIIYAW